MTKPNTTRIAAILDRSSSMSPVAAATVRSLNDFIAEQRKVTTDVATFSLTQFNSEHTTIGPVPLSEVPEITVGGNLFGRMPVMAGGQIVGTSPGGTGWSYWPSGNTALYGTVLAVIDGLGAELSAMAEEERPSDVIVLIQTDGQDNASLFGTREVVAAKIKHQQEVYNWKFLFIGANIDVDAAVQGLNIPLANSVAYTHSNAGTEAVMKSLSRSVSSYRSSRDDAALSLRGSGDDVTKGSGPITTIHVNAPADWSPSSDDLAAYGKALSDAASKGGNQ